MTTVDKSVKRLLNRRASLLHPDNKTVPTHHEAMSNLGKFLGETVLNEMSPIAKEMMRIDNPFPDAPKTVWLSPSDRINGNIFLKPPPNDDAIKALTHEGILEIGSTLEEKLEKHFQARIKAAKREVEEFERFECNNRIKFALQQERIAHEAALKDQRLQLLKMFQKDRDELIEESKSELETITKKLTYEHDMKREQDVRMSMKQTEFSANQKINKLTERMNSLESELEDTQKMVEVEVEKRKSQDWQILHEMFIEMHRQFNAKLAFLHNQHNAEIRQLFLEIKTQTVDSEQTTTFNEEVWDDDDSGTINVEQEDIASSPSHEGRPFVINLCKVEGESSEDDKSTKCDDHSSNSSYKCHKHRSKPKSDGEQGSFDCKMLHDDSQSANIPTDLNDINTTDVSCNVLRRLGLNFNVANIEKVKIELDNLLLNVNKRGETKLLTATDSLDLFGNALESENIPGSEESNQKQEPEDGDRAEYRRIMNRKKSKQLQDAKLAVPLTIEEYMTTLIPMPKYMESPKTNISLWDYKAMTDEEWNNLLQELDDKLQSQSNDTNSESKNVTLNSRNSLVSMKSAGKIVSNLSNLSKKPARGILRASVESKMDSEFLLKNEVFQTDKMQSLVKKLCDE